jgi:DNA-binding transcriptional LysR family regulator
MEATECGELLYARAKNICYLMDDIKKEISIMSGGKGVLSVLVTYSTTSTIPADMLFRFTDLNPDIQMKLREFPDEFPIGKLIQEEVDVGFILGEKEIENCEYELIESGELVVVVSKDHPLASKDLISIKELENEPLIIKSEEAGKEHSLVDKCLEYGFTPHIVHEFGNIATEHKLCEAKKYVAVSVDLVEHAFRNENLKVIRLMEKIPQNIYMVSRKRDIQSKAISSFRRYVKEFRNDK